jgi:hypothetical protein
LCQTDTYRDFHSPHALKRETAGFDLSSRPFGGIFGFADTGVRKYNRELLSTISGDKVHFTRDFIERLSNTSKYGITRLMAVPIIESLEVIDIDEDQGEWGVFTLKLGATPLKFVIEGTTVGDFREGILQRVLTMRLT